MSSNTDVFLNITSKIESLSIKKIDHDRYILYGLLWHEFIKNDKPCKALISIKSSNLKWKFTQEIITNYDHIVYYEKGSNKCLGNFLCNCTRELFYKIILENIADCNDVLMELTFLNEGRDGFMKYNIYEKLDEYIVKVNVPGIEKDEIQVLIEDEIIKVKLNPKHNIDEDTEVKLEMFKPIKSEAEIYLPNVKNINAELKNGILILTAPKINKAVKVDIK